MKGKKVSRWIQLSVFITLTIAICLVTLRFLPDVLQSQNSESEGIEYMFDTQEEITQNEETMIEEHFATGSVFNREDLFIQDGQRKYVPTNTIWSNIIFSGTIRGLFTFPLAIESTDSGLQVALPEISATEKVITADTNKNNLEINFNSDIVEYEVLDWSDLTVTVNGLNANQEKVAEFVFVQGSPFIYVNPIENKVTITTKSFDSTNRENEFSNQRSRFSVFNYSSIQTDSNEVSVEGDSWLSIAMYRDSDDYTIIDKYSDAIVDSIYVELIKQGDTFKNTFAVSTKTGQRSTILGFLPNHELSGEAIFTIDTLRGNQEFFVVKDTISSFVDEVEMVENLEFTGTSQEREMLYDQLVQDFENDDFVSTTSYFGAKKLAKLARMIEIAESIEAEDLVEIFSETLRVKMLDWITYSGESDPVFLERDYEMGGVVAHKPAFGSENYSDHHFHYGYFMHAAAVLGKHNPDFIEQYRDVFDLWFKDIVNTDREDNRFPVLRHFDWYEGHSWASGTAPFGDGNNQESSSEAINAYWASWKWARLIGDEELETISEYAYSAEVNATRLYWFNDTDILNREGYIYPKASLVWGGKTEYATWFSSDPLAIEAIQYIPITPGSLYLENEEIIRRDKSFLDNNQVVLDPISKFSDLNAAYYAIEFEDFQNTDWSQYNIDDGNSISNMMAWSLYWKNNT
jgi:hypothetical protein